MESSSERRQQVPSMARVRRPLSSYGFLVCPLFPISMGEARSRAPLQLRVGSLLPGHISFEHWRLALAVLRRRRRPVVTPAFPGARWLWTIKVRRGVPAASWSRLSDHLGPYAFRGWVPRQGADASRDERLMLLHIFPGGGRAGRDLQNISSR